MGVKQAGFCCFYGLHLSWMSTALSVPTRSIVPLPRFDFSKEIRHRHLLGARIKCLTCGAHRAANCPPAGRSVTTSLMKQAEARRGLGRKKLTVTDVHTCAYRLYIAWRESSWNVMTWRGSESRRRKEAGGGGRAEQSSGADSVEGIWGGRAEKIQKQIWSGKPVHHRRSKTRRFPQNQPKNQEKEKHWRTHNENKENVIAVVFLS